MSSQALASLTATYTDSEGEDANDDQSSGEEVVETITPPSKVQSRANSSSNSPAVPPARLPKLVSYHDDTIASDDEDVNEIEEPRIESNTEVIEPESRQPSPEPELPTDDGIQLPPPPKKKCPPDLQEKFTKLYEKLGSDMNYAIQQRKDFRNPSIYEKLVQYCGINELGTNYPADIYDPLKWGKESFYEELGKVQNADMEAREKERKERTKVEFVSGTKKQAEDEAKRRKSKWDQPAINAALHQTIKPAGLVQPTLTTSATGTKGTVISAFGSLPKKPRI